MPRGRASRIARPPWVGRQRTRDQNDLVSYQHVPLTQPSDAPTPPRALPPQGPEPNRASDLPLWALLDRDEATFRDDLVTAPFGIVPGGARTAVELCRRAVTVDQGRVPRTPPQARRPPSWRAPPGSVMLGAVGASWGRDAVPQE